MKTNQEYDSHGYVAELRALLAKLGYGDRDGAHRHGEEPSAHGHLDREEI